MKDKTKIISTRGGGKQKTPFQLNLQKIYWKTQWTTKNIGSFVIPCHFKIKSSGKFIDGVCTKGFISTKGKKVKWGKQYSSLFWIGLID